MRVCGLWQGTRRLAAVIVDDDGQQLRPPITTPATPNQAYHLLTYLATADIGTLILAEDSHIIFQARILKLPVLLAPDDLLHAIRTATGLHRRPPHNTAILLARWYLTPALRRYLRKLHPPLPQANQPTLF